MKKTQIGWVILIAAVFVIGITTTQPASTNQLFYIIVGMILMVILFGTLTLSVDDEYVAFSFGIGLIRGKYKIDEITVCRPLSYFPLGWGIRFRPGATLFNVSGNKAIEIRRRGKRDIWIGTEFPDEFAAYINEKMEQKSKNSI